MRYVGNTSESCCGEPREEMIPDGNSNWVQMDEDYEDYAGPNSKAKGRRALQRHPATFENGAIARR